MSPSRFAPNCRRGRQTTKAAVLLVFGSAFSPAVLPGTAEGVEAFENENYEKALDKLEPAAKEGDRKALVYLARMYYEGRGVEKDVVRAIRLFRSAAEAGDSKAMVTVGYAYSNGIGVSTDNARAVKWYRKAADAGNAVAQRNLGLMYEEGEGVYRDYKKSGRVVSTGS